MSPQPFIPEPLPPALDYNAELVQAVADSNRQLGELAGLARQLANPHLLIRPFIQREAVLSSRIEGTEADVTDLYAYEAGQRLLFDREIAEADVLEVRNYVLALEYGLDRLSSLPVSSRLFREMHEILMSGVRGQLRSPGEFRKVRDWIGPPGCSIEEASFIPPPPQEVPGTLGALESYVNDSDPSHPRLVRLAFIHYQFEAIHPFLDGNGRIGRLLISLLLVHWDLLPLPLLYLSAYFESRRSGYYTKLLQVSTQGDWRSWTLFFLRGIEEQAGSANRLVKRFQDLQQSWREKLSGPGVSTLTIELMESLFETPILSIPMAVERLDVTYPSAKRHVDRLVEAGILSLVSGSKYPKLFAAREIVDSAKTKSEARPSE